MIFKTFSFIAAALVTLLTLWALGWLWFATNIALSAPEATNKNTDAIIVLTGGNGRVNEGLNLLSQNKAPKLFISGVHKNTTKEDVYNSWSNITPDRPCCIDLGYSAQDTIGNANEVQSWIEKNDVESVRLVTSSYHMPRALQEIKQTVRNKEIIAHPVFTDDFQAWKGRFWSLTFSEYNKTILRKLEMVLNSERAAK